MKQFNFTKGREGEEIARKYLEQKGYLWIESNHKNYLGEIDIIMAAPSKSVDQFTSGSGVLVFVEVKLKIGDRFGLPEEMINKSKIARVKRIAQAFLVLKPEYTRYKKQNIEAVCVVLNPDHSISRITHYENLA